VFFVAPDGHAEQRAVAGEQRAALLAACSRALITRTLPIAAAI
jgi:hypothetical protein